MIRSVLLLYGGQGGMEGGTANGSGVVWSGQPIR